MTPTERDRLRERADQQWKLGQLAAARESYARLCEADPADWPARFQCAWIDAAFAPPHAATLEALRAPDLGDGARRRLELLAQRATASRFLAGGVADWDIAALRQQDLDGKDARWWDLRADLAAQTGQYGLASACHREAAELDPGAYVRPPAKVSRLTAQLAQHLAEIHSS